MPQVAQERKTKLVSSSDNLNPDSAVTNEDRADIPGQREGCRIHSQGPFSMGFMDEPGVFTWADGLKYEGDFVSFAPMGQGTYTWPDGSSYKGDVFNGVRHGYGAHKSANNCVSYTGQWHQGKRHGKGAVYYNQDKTSWYKGDWVMNTREGWGVRCYPSGNIYYGEWKNNVRHGNGTMWWLNLRQKYVGEWQYGVQHGQGKHIWFLLRLHGSQYCQMNQYTGDFVQGERHGQGTFDYTDGEIYEGEWKNNKKHGQGKLTFEDGHIFEGEFVNDQMATRLSGNRAPSLYDKDASVPGPDMTVNIECLLDKIPKRNRYSERKQVEFVVQRHHDELKSIYSFYSRLGQAHPPDNVSLLSRMQFWRLLKDCNIHHHGVTLMQLDFYIREDSTASTDVFSPFTFMLLCRLLSCLVVLSYHLYHDVMKSQKYLLASCFTKLLTDDILPNAQIVKGFLFRQPECAVLAMKYIQKCRDVYQAFSRATAAGNGHAMTYRHLLWMFKDLNLLDDKLTTARLLEVITAESPDPTNPSSCMDVEIIFLEFIEVLVGCVEVKCLQVSRGVDEELPQAGRSSNSPELTSAQHVGSQQDLTASVTVKPQFSDKPGDREVMKATDYKSDIWTEMLHQFFNQLLFPAFDHHQLVTRYMKENMDHSG
ncbi:radial spoke head 10 homolog B [Aulostomus maculatus]